MLSPSYELLTSAILAGALALYLFKKTFSRSTVADVPGPVSRSLVTGNLGELLQGEVGVFDSQWTEQFGPVTRFKGCFGEDYLFIVDPKALHHIHHRSGYVYKKPVERVGPLLPLLGHGILIANGNAHKRHKKAMQPAFRGPQLKHLAPVFAKSTGKLVKKWQDILIEKEGRTAIFNVPAWTARATLDTLGQAAFDYDFGALEESDNALAKAFHNLLLDSFSKLSPYRLLFQAYMRKIPTFVIRLLQSIPTKAQRRGRYISTISSQVARELISQKAAAIQGGKGERDVMSLLVAANANGTEAGGLSEEEMIAQMKTLLLAGHETVATTLSWALYELAQNPDVQSKLRSEINLARGGSSMASIVENDFSGMKYLQAFIKEVLRLNPLLFHVFREATSTDVLPLSKPLTLLSGETVTELPIRKGQRLVSSVYGYNRYKPVWGPDADVFNPERWLGVQEEPETKLGIYGNMLTFLEGPRTCIGWRFALLELQTYIVEIVGTFELAIPKDAKRICRHSSNAMIPVVEGEFEKGVQLPLQVTFLS